MKIAVFAVVVLLGGILVQSSSAPPTRCKTGESRGFATVKPFPPYRAGQIPGAFSSSPRWFLRRYNCRGGSAEVRHLQTGVFDLRFPGLRVRAVAGVGLSESQMSVGMQPLGDIVRVRLFSRGLPADAAFSVVVY